MIPSDHFVRFYNEVFKFLEAAGPGELEKFWETIGDDQNRHCLQLFQEKGLKGMFDYWEHIRIEENCDLKNTLFDDHIEIDMRQCPSLTKNLDNDAGCYERYCDHCPGWVGQVLTAAGYWMVYDIIDRQTPKCTNYIYKNRLAAKQKKLALQQHGHHLVHTNFKEKTHDQ